ncbi:hypothetical protein LCGC14_2949630 [marine sediment metagenome]|uniref:Uncharacterized protein n=1 Tax=marine sediment metagenome TaxID=412755 RepID=A0A0F8XGA0_9ZZZZ
METQNIRRDRADTCDLEGSECDHWDWHERLVEDGIDFRTPHGCVFASHAEVVCDQRNDEHTPGNPHPIGMYPIHYSSGELHDAWEEGYHARDDVVTELLEALRTMIEAVNAEEYGRAWRVGNSNGHDAIAKAKS